MRTNIYRRAQALLVSLLALAVFTMPLTALAQTRISYHSNKYSPSDDVKIGQQAAAEVEQKMPVIHDEEITAYLESVGRRLVAAVPPEFQHPEFRYSFRAINARDINAFALPGGPMFVNTGMILAAHEEGEMAGVMAHELSHVVLRHGTAQATKAQKYSLLAGILGVGGTILGGPALGQLGAGSVGVYFLHFSREYETEADILGAQIMARAGYDPRDLAQMFKTIEQQSGGSGGGFFSDHPNPSNRYERINQEAQMLRVSNPIRESAEFTRIQQRLRGGRVSSGDYARNGQRYPSESGNYPTSNIGGRVGYPSSRYQTYNGNQFRLSYPSNWREVGDNNSLWFVPEGAYGQIQGQAVYTHGVNVGETQAQSRDLRQATDAFINALAQGNGNLRQQSGYQRTTIDRHNALAISLSNVNEATGRPEIVTVYTTLLRNGDLFYFISVAPQSDYSNFQTAFRTVLNSIQLND
jgi:Zn-dependent protease with chaperone function